MVVLLNSVLTGRCHAGLKRFETKAYQRLHPTCYCCSSEVERRHVEHIANPQQRCSPQAQPGHASRLSLASTVDGASS